MRVCEGRQGKRASTGDPEESAAQFIKSDFTPQAVFASEGAHRSQGGSGLAKLIG